MNFYVVYRISDKGHNADKNKLSNATKTHCLQNAIEHFGRERFHVIADNCSPELLSFIKSEGLDLEETHLGNSPSFKYAVKYAVRTYSDDDIVYLLEDDYLHLPDSMKLITEGMEIADYVTLYDHPHHYTTGNLRLRGACPMNRFGIHNSRVFVTASTHWKETHSTTMTFAAKVRTLKEDLRIFMDNPDKGVPEDFITFLKLTKQRNLFDAFRVFPYMKLVTTILFNNFALFRRKRLLLSCIPGRATHCEIAYLSPFIDWSKI